MWNEFESKQAWVQISVYLLQLGDVAHLPLCTSVTLSGQWESFLPHWVDIGLNKMIYRAAYELMSNTWLAHNSCSAIVHSSFPPLIPN